MSKDYDYIICGAGAAGLMLAYRMVSDDFFKGHRILLIDKNSKNTNDRTWCFWEAGNGDWDQLLYREWEQAFFGSKTYSKSLKLQPYLYKMLKGIDFYNFIVSELEKYAKVTFVKDEVIELKDEGDIVNVFTSSEKYTAKKVFNSIFDPEKLKLQQEYRVLQQHFVGWFVKTEEAAFNSEVVTYMDFSIPQRGNTRFMYVLPTSNREALLEYTLFSEDQLPKEEYEAAIVSYLKEIGVENYKIQEKEYGSIPMTCFPFEKDNTLNVLHIGTAGGWTKASTGYTFRNTTKKTKQLLQHIKEGKSLQSFPKRNRFWYYDLLLLDVLTKHNERGSKLFTVMFKRNKVQQIFRFLDEETTFLEELRITFSMIGHGMEKALLRRLFK